MLTIVVTLNKLSKNSLRTILRQCPLLESWLPENEEKMNTRQSLFMMAVAMPSWMERGVASQVRRCRYAKLVRPVCESQ